MSHPRTRRAFVQASLAASAIPLFGASGRSASASAIGKLRTAHIGVGGMGGSDLGSIASHSMVEVAALCDVDSSRLAKAQEKHPNAKLFSDYREMLASYGSSIDAVVVSTPDHTHAPAAMTAMNLNKPVYCQKPLTHEVFEARQLRAVAESKKLVTQMGIQVHSSVQYRRAVQMIQSNVIGKVSQVHAWSNKNWGYDGGPLAPAKVPDTLKWDLWLGVTPSREYSKDIYHPGNWRKLIDFGTGTLGDMGVHIFDTPYAALELTAPNWVKTTCRPATGIGHPEKNTVEYQFPATRYTTETLQWIWYDGSFAPPSVDSLKLPQGFKLPGQGSLFVGQEGVLLLPHIGEAILFPEEKFSDYVRPKLENKNHYHEWVDACMGNGSTSASFSYAGPLTEALLLGVVANRYPGQQLDFDAKRLEIKNMPEANKLLKRSYRAGFEVPGLS